MVAEKRQIETHWVTTLAQPATHSGGGWKAEKCQRKREKDESERAGRGELFRKNTTIVESLKMSSLNILYHLVWPKHNQGITW